MDFAGEQYYKLNRFLLLGLGLWPYQNSTLKKIQIIFFQTLFISFLICQFNTFLVRQCNVDLVVKVMLFISINGVYIIKYNGFLLLTGNIGCILNGIQHDWNMLKSQAELKILQKYAGSARLYTIQFFSLATFVVLSYIMLSCIPIMLDVIVPMNESRPRPLLIVIELFVDQEIYFYPILTYSFLSCCAGGVTVVAVAMISIAYALHTCALFEITRYRIERIIDKSVLQKPEHIKQYILYEKLICAVHIHRRALDLTNTLTTSFTTLYFVLLGFAIAMMSFNLYFLFNAAMSLDDPVELLVAAGFIIIELYYVFLGNYIGQNVIDTSVDIHQIIYSTQWYAAPLWMQKSLLFVMKRSSRRSALIAGGLFQASLESFAMLMSTTISYVMLLLSVRGQQKKSQGEL